MARKQLVESGERMISENPVDVDDTC